jgi:RNA polymerase sigma factor (sigma-70 family)
MVTVKYEIDRPDNDNDSPALPESALAAEVKYETDLQFLRKLINEAVDFILEDFEDMDEVREQFAEGAFSLDFVESALHDRFQDVDDPEIGSILAEAATKVRFLADYLNFQLKNSLKGDVSSFVREKKAVYKKTGKVNKLTLELFGCKFNTVTNVLTNDKKNLNLTPEEADIWERVRRGDIEAINGIIQKNEMLIRKVIMQLYAEYVINGTFFYEDLHNEGILGLRKAVIRYNPRFGYRFSTSAYNWIRSYVSGYIYKNLNTLHYPINMVSRSESSERGILHLDASVNTNDLKRSFHNIIGLDCPEFEEDDFQKKLRQKVTDHIYNFDFSQVGYRSLDRDLAFHIAMSYFFEEPGATLKQIANCWGNTKRTGKPYSIEAIRKFKEAIVESFKHNPGIIDLLID